MVIGGSPETHLTEPMQLEIGQPRETIQFMMVPKITGSNTRVVLVRQVGPYHMVAEKREMNGSGERTLPFSRKPEQRGFEAVEV